MYKTSDGHPRARVHRGQTGGGVIDLLITLALVGIMTAAIGPYVKGALGAYSRNGAARNVLAAIRRAQSQAITRGVVIQVQWGAGTGIGRPASQYRIVKDTTGACSFPAVGAAVDGTNVIEGWTDLVKDFKGTSIQSIVDAGASSRNGVMFNSLGASVNTCTASTFPVTVTITDDLNRTKTIQVASAGGATLQ